MMDLNRFGLGGREDLLRPPHVGRTTFNDEDEVVVSDRLLTAQDAVFRNPHRMHRHTERGEAVDNGMLFNGLENPDDRTFEDMRIRFLTNMKGDVDAVAAPFELMVDEIVFKRRPDSQLSDPEYLKRFLGLYEIADQKITIGLKGNTLVASVAGQGQLELVPDRDDEFNLKDIAGISIKFVVNEDGSVVALFKQPNGVFEAKRQE